MGAKQGWVKMPVEPAARWLKLSAVARGIGADLFRVYQDTVVGLDMDEVEDAFTRLLGPNPGERKTVRMAIRSIIDAGLIASVEGGVRLLYSRETYVEHGVENQRTVPQPYVNGTATIPVPYANGTPKVPEPYVEGPVSVGGKSAESLDPVFTQEREKERKKERNTSLPLLPHEPLLEGDEEPEPETGIRKLAKTDPVFAHWVAVMGKTSAAKLTDDRRKKLKARRAEGYTDEQLCQAIDGCKLSPFHMGENDRSETYDDLVTILKDGKTTDAHIKRAAEGVPNRGSSDDLPAHLHVSAVRGGGW